MIKLKLRHIIIFAITIVTIVACDKDKDKEEEAPVLKGTTWKSGGTVLYFSSSDSIKWTTYYAGTSSSIFGTYKFSNPNIEMKLKGLNGEIAEFDGTVQKDTMNLNFMGGMIFYKHLETAN